MRLSISKIFRTSSLDKLGKRRSSTSVHPEEETQSLFNDPNTININSLPYDIIQKITSYVHENVILTQSFLNISLVCKRWRTYSCISGQIINLDKFFQRTQALKMKTDLVEKCLTYITGVYRSLDTVLLSGASMTNTKSTLFLLEKVERLSNLHLDLIKCDNKFLSQLCSYIKVKKTMRALSAVNAHTDHFFYICDLLEHCQGIRSLTLTNIFFSSDDDAKPLNDYLKDNTTITDLNLNLSGCSSLDSIKNLMNTNSNLKSLHIQNISNTTSTFNFVYNHHNLKELSLSHCNLTNQDFLEIADILSTNGSIQQLDLSYNKQVDSSSINQLLNTLINNKNQSITHLNLSGLELDNYSMSLLGTFVQSSKLIQLEVSDCPNTWDDGFVQFSRGIEINNTLCTLILNRNKILTNDSLMSHLKSKSFHSLELHGTLQHLSSSHLFSSNCNSIIV